MNAHCDRGVRCNVSLVGLLPFTWLYRAISRHLKHKDINSRLQDARLPLAVPVIIVGNVNVGGTGKTPQIEYLIRLFKGDYNVGVLSRGYKRKTVGFVLASKISDAKQIGDEPFQYYQKFKGIKVAVDEQRVHGIKQLLATNNPPELILLDDAYQHRKVTAGLYILSVSYTHLTLPTNREV